MREKKKAIIITIYDPYPNMGNRLQNYAVQTILEKNQIEVMSLSFLKPVFTNKQKLKHLVHKLTRYKYSRDENYWKLLPKQIERFEEFNNQYIKTCFIKNIEQIPEADFYVLGSDQLWNPQWWNKEKPQMEQNIYLATFAEPDKILCISPSFGRSYVPEEWETWFAQKLKRIPCFSVREDAGKALIKKLTGKDAVVTIDPTLMLSREEWNQIAQKPKGWKEEKRYILIYFIGGKTARISKELDTYKNQLKAEVYNLFDKEDKNWYFVNPAEFIYMIQHAELILTDSFHACVFSFIYGRPFLLYNRENAPDMMSRMETFFEKFDLKRKYVDSGLVNDLLECDYSIGYQNLKKEQNKLNAFLKKALKTET